MKMIHMLCCSLLLVTASFAQRSSPEANALIGTWAGGPRLSAP
jgi:hypothetical protein